MLALAPASPEGSYERLAGIAWIPTVVMRPSISSRTVSKAEPDMSSAPWAARPSSSLLKFAVMTASTAL